MKTTARISLLMLFVMALLAVLAGGAWAEETSVEESPAAESESAYFDELEALLAGEAEVEMYQFPDIPPRISLFVGYRTVEDSGSGEAAGEYHYLDDSEIFDVHARLFEYPHRFFLEMDRQNRQDYFGELRYAYGDVVLLRWLATSVWHNTGNVTLLDLDTATTSPGVDVQDAGRDYGVRFATEQGYLRLKTPNFPFHVYGNYSWAQKSGTVQQRSLQGSGWFNNAVRTTQKRDVEFETETYGVGLNSHLGPVEADLTHTQKQFEPRLDEVFYDSYTNGARVAGTYPHNLTPETEGSSSTLKLHTSYTGKLVASATFSVKDRENTTSGVESDTFVGAGGVTWMPATPITFFLRYRRVDVEPDNPSTVTIVDRMNPANSTTSSVRPSLETTTDRLSLTARYRPLSRLTLRGTYRLEDVERDNAEDWGLRDNTTTNAGSVSGSLRLTSSLDMDADYLYEHTDNPAYNNEPDDLYEGSVALSWRPVPQLTGYVSYGLTLEDREFLRYSVTDSARNREVARDRALASVTVMPHEILSFTVAYAYLRNETEQDLAYENASGFPVVAEDATYEEQTHSIGLDTTLIPWERLVLVGGVTYAQSEGTFDPRDPGLEDPVPVSEFVDYEFAETEIEISGEYRVTKGFFVGAEWHYADVDMNDDNIHDDLEEGDVQEVMLRLRKEWK